ncbi:MULTISPECIES: type VII secretion protein EccB [Streptomyces]|uniref:Type VII secretion protein EccB n=1 Tax=Streptomyces dengpaensis TaxID=2049881 RepID=A0ABN5HZE3_9ACTN|nr:MULTISPECIES: type VII secretion protein EccB [Streptomyces]AVH56173.1 type VII secretion protein EccB [Streptomyces dengpaensis]PIB07131.1 type VII secretion protein EccB [Streptomyces sp. HG99]
MASRRDQLNAYTFAKRRMLASFVQSSPDGSEEGAPRPLRAVVPGAIVGVIIMAVFGAWGMFKPTAPKGWDTVGEKVIVASDSTTRYVVLKTDGKVQLHPVLNMASAKLLLNTGKGEVVTVDESILDKGTIPRGVTIGIPYAPDRLPAASEADSAKRWAVCERPSAGGRSIQKAAFVLASRDMSKTEGTRQKLHGGELLYVVGPDKTRYIVDASGTSYEVDASDELLLRTLVGSGREPQRVSTEWLETLHPGDPIAFPTIEGQVGAEAGVAGDLPAEVNKVGMVLKAPNGATEQHYVVEQGKVAPVSDFTAKLLLNSRDLVSLGQAGKARDVSAGAFVPSAAEFAADRDWPSRAPVPVNEAEASDEHRNTICNVLRDVDEDKGTTTLSTWAGTDFPAPLPTGSSSAYVTPGFGQLYRQFQGEETKAGGVFLVTDTGLRYAMQSNDDSATDDAGIGVTAKERKELQQEAQLAQIRLGYSDVDPAPIPVEWSSFLSTGPRLSTSAARQPQGS